MNLTIGQRISARGENFIITGTDVNYDGSFIIDAEGISEMVKEKISIYVENQCTKLKQFQILGQNLQNLKVFH